MAVLDILQTIVIIVPSVLSICVSGIYAYIALAKLKEPKKDEVWATTEKMLCNKLDEMSADDFAKLYLLLKFFKEHPEDLKGFDTIEDALRAKRETERKEQK